MIDLFPSAVGLVLEAEGVFSDQAGDPGGPTWFGIARASHPDIPWPPTKDQAVAIYRSGYWDAHRCGEMPWPWALAIFDGEVNQGSVIGLAQAALGLKVDGNVGPVTLAAIQKASAESLEIFLALRLLSYTHAAAFPVDGKGWFKRVVRVAMAAAKPSLPQTL